MILDSITGVGPQPAEVILPELGLDMSQSPTTGLRVPETEGGPVDLVIRRPRSSGMIHRNVEAGLPFCAWHRTRTCTMLRGGGQAISCSSGQALA